MRNCRRFYGSHVRTPAVVAEGQLMVKPTPVPPGWAVYEINPGAKRIAWFGTRREARRWATDQARRRFKVLVEFRQIGEPEVLWHPAPPKPPRTGRKA